MEYVPGLDGLRGVAVIAVLLFHGGVSWAKGGFLGVDAFFVLSGYLITALLLGEWAGEGTISLRAFWIRRARRLLPAMLAVVMAVAAYGTWLLPADAKESLRGDGLATLGYVANWRFVVSDASYFGAAELPSPLRHMWSLAIEEQFYLLWPVLVLWLLRRGFGRRTLFGMAAGGAVVSAGLMALWSESHSRVFYGTDTRGQSLLVGAALAFLPWRRVRVPGWAGVVAGALLLWVWATTAGDADWLYRGGFLACGLAVALVVAVVVGAPRTVLSWEPLVVVGRLSYGLYLWHWPVYLTLNGERTGLSGAALLAVRLLVTLVVSVLSFRFLELPVRHGGRRVGAWSDVRLLRVLPVATMAVVGVLVASTVVPSVSGDRVSAAASAPAPSPPTTAALPPPKRVVGKPVKVMLIGDSVSVSLGWGLAAQGPKFEAKVASEGVLGCGVSRGTPYRDQDRTPEQPPQCATWPDAWKAAVDKHDPDVVAVLMSRWEVMDRMRDGRWQRIGEPAYDRYLRDELERAVDVVSARGGRVALVTSPYYKRGEQPNGEPWPQDDPARVNRWNALLREVAARRPGSVVVIDLGAHLSPGGKFTRLVDGVAVRAADGVHFTVPGGRWVAPWLLPQLTALVS